MPDSWKRASRPHALRNRAAIAVSIAFLTAGASCHRQSDPVSPGPASPTARGTWTTVTGYFPIGLDSTKLLTIPSADSAKMYRTDIELTFRPALTDSAKNAFFARENITVLGYHLRRGVFFVRLPDPGPSIETFYAALARLDSLPEVEHVSPIFHTAPLVEREVRFPADGAGMRREDWFNGSQSTWAHRAIRATLAWGCEQGEYGGSLVNVGVLEVKHERQHPEFANSAQSFWEPDDNQLQRFPPRSAYDAEKDVEHATYVTGLLTASGNDSGGVSGVMWRTRLHQFALASSAHRLLPLASSMWALGDEIAAQNTRVLSISVDFPFPRGYNKDRQEADVRALAGAIKTELLDKLPNLTIVVAAGNDKFRGTVQQFVRSERAHFLRAALLVLKADSGQFKRIIVVAGTQPNNNFWTQSANNPAQGSNFFDSATDIAAPAANVHVLARWTGQAHSLVPVTTDNGTSLAAPLVSGVVAQLLSMAPSLTPADIHDYVTRGATVSRQDRQSGADVAHAPLQNVPDNRILYELDAYGALTLLSRERAGTPVCGLEVTGHSDSKLRIGRATPEVVAPSESYGAWEGVPVSVAQGGRLLSIFGAEAPATAYAQTFQLTSAGWSGHQVVGAEMLIYLEQDTAYVRKVPRDQDQYDLYVRLGSTKPGRSAIERSVSLEAPTGTQGGWHSFWPSGISPTGDWIVFDWVHSDAGECVNGSGQPMTTTMYAFPLRYIGTKTFFASTRDFCKTEEPYYPEGYDEGGPAAWTASGNTLITARNVIHGTTLGTDHRRFTVTRTSMTASGTTTTVPDRYTTFMTWSPEGGRLHTTEVTLPDWTPCLRRMRSASTPTSLFGSGVDCYPGAPAASPNMLLARLAPLARRAITRSSPWHDAQAARAELSKRRARAR